jgi:hypothetical protein
MPAVPREEAQDRMMQRMGTVNLVSALLLSLRCRGLRAGAALKWIFLFFVFFSTV